MAKFSPTVTVQTGIFEKKFIHIIFPVKFSNFEANALAGSRSQNLMSRRLKFVSFECPHLLRLPAK
jgi:hypothetical protein